MPFLDEKPFRFGKVKEDDEISDLSDIEMVSPRKFFFDSSDDISIDSKQKLKEKHDYLIYINIAGAICCLLIVLFWAFSSPDQTPIEELPVIKAEITPIKEKPETEQVVPHMDKKIYTYISKDAEAPQRKTQVKTVVHEKPQAVSAENIDTSKLTEEDRKTIVKAFEDLSSNEGVKVPQETKVVATLPPPPVIAVKEEVVLPSVKKVSPISSKVVQKTAVTVKNVQQPVQQIAPRQRKIVELINQQIHSDEQGLKTIKERSPRTVKENTILVQPISQSKPEKIASGYYMQLASLTSSKEAQSEYNRLLKKYPSLWKYPYIMRKVDTPKGLRYSILLGPEKDPREFTNLKKSLNLSNALIYSTK